MAAEDFYRVLAEVSGATSYVDLFPGLNGDSDTMLSQLKRAYRQRAVHIHPDKVDVWNQAVATDAFHRLTALYDEAVTAVQDDTVGKVRSAVVFTTAGGTHTLSVPADEWSDMAACHEAESVIGGKTMRSFVKIARTPADNDLIAAEAETLKRLTASGDPKRLVYYPVLLDTFGAKLDGKRVRANVFAQLDGFYNLEQVRQARPNGLDPLDAAWMWRRLLWALDYIHDKGVVHGAVLPQNIMILPAQHGLVLVDWAYSAMKRGSDYPPAKAVVTRQRGWYPEGVLKKHALAPAVDITMAARSFVYLMGGNPVTGELPHEVPARMRAYFKELAAHGAPDAPTAAIGYDSLLQQLGQPYYPRTFRPFVL